MSRKKIIYGSDLFCGAGGTSSGLIKAIKSLGYDYDLLAINHWDIAIATHKLNHERVKHLCQNLDKVDPLELVPGGRLDILVASPECFVAGTLILTKRGLIPIEDVVVDDFVLTHRGRWRRVTDIMQSGRKTVIAKGHGHYGLETSEAHPFYSRTRTAKYDNGTRRYVWEYSEPEWTPTSEMVIPKTSSWHTDQIRLWATPATFEPLPIPDVGGRGMSFIPEFWWSVGRWLGDGGVRLRDSGSEIWIVSGKHETLSLESRLAKFRPEAGRAVNSGELAWRHRDMRTASIFECSHDGLARWLVENFGRHADGKEIPSWVYGMPSEWREQLLLGYLSADGWQDIRKREGSSVSKKLAIGIRLLAASIGHQVALHIAEPREDAQIEGRHINESVAYRIVYVKELKRKHGANIGDHIWQKIRSVTPTGDKIKTLYNLAVEEDESYVADGIVVHNCTHHSNARGGKPRSDQKRADAWLLMRWLEKLYVKNLLIENVKEFMNWGPLGANGQPLKSKRGMYFKQFIDTLQINYNLEYKIINCANFGDPTTRERFFLMARRHSHPHFVWPAYSHASPVELKKRKANPALFADLFGEKATRLKPWRTARQDVIDWNIESRSIFDRKKPLSPNTMARIFAGLRKHSGLAIVMATGGRQTSANPRGTDEPVPTVMPNGRLNVVEAVATPFVMKLSHTKSKNDHTRTSNAPLTTITSLQEHAVVEASVENCDPFVVNMKGKSKSRSIDEPTVAQTTKPHQYLCESQVSQVLVNHKGKAGRSRSVDAPTFTQCAGGTTQSLVEGEITPFTVGAGGPTGQSHPRSVDEPARTILTDDHQALVETEVHQANGDGDAFIIHSGGPDVDARSVDEPTRTLLAREHQALVETKLEPFIVTNNHGTDGGRNRTHDVDKPMPAVTTIDAWSVIEPYLIQFFGEREGQEARTRSVDDPAWTVTTQERIALVEPHILSYHGSHKGRKDGSKRTKSVDEPLPAQDTSNRFGVVEGEVAQGEAFLLKSYTGSDSASLNQPAPTITAAYEHLGLVENEVIKGDPNLIKFYGTAKGGQSIDDPLDAVTAKDRFALVEPTLVRIKGDGKKKDVVGLYIPSLSIIVDIRFRMLQPPELAAAMSFPKGYKFAGNRENKVMQIGNAVPCKTAQALCKALLTEPEKKPRKLSTKLKKAA